MTRLETWGAWQIPFTFVAPKILGWFIEPKWAMAIPIFLLYPWILCAFREVLRRQNCSYRIMLLPGHELEEVKVDNINLDQPQVVVRADLPGFPLFTKPRRKVVYSSRPTCHN